MHTTVSSTCFTCPLMCRSCTGMCLRRSMHQRSASSRKYSMLSKGIRGKRTSSKLTTLSNLLPHQHIALHETCYDANTLPSCCSTALSTPSAASALHPHPVVECSLVGLQPLHAFIHFPCSERSVLHRPGPVLVQQPARFSLLAIAQQHVQGAAGQHSRLHPAGCHILLSNPA